MSAIVINLDLIQDYKRRFLAAWRKGQEAAWELCDLCVEADRLGEEVYQVLDELEIDYQQFRRWQRLAYTFPPGKRNMNLSISHHEEVMRLLPEVAQSMLVLAEEKQWSKAELRQKVQQIKTAEAKKPAPPQTQEPTEDVKAYIKPRPHVEAIVLTEDGRIEHRDSRKVNIHEYFISSQVAAIMRYTAQFKEEEPQIVKEIIRRLQTYVLDNLCKNDNLEKGNEKN